MEMYIKMGSGISCSGALKCPKDFDNKKFSKIRMLFDKLDSNGDRLVDSSELTQISNLHVENNVRELERKKQLSLLRKQRIDLFLDEDSKNKLEEIQKDSDESKLRNVIFTNNKIIGYNMEINYYKKLSKEEKQKIFLKKVTNNKGHIVFWKFFEYMKSKTNDIENITWED
jgi:hypothetical protein